MAGESHLRVYIHRLLRHWRLIALATVLAGVVALAVTSVAPVKYQAAAMVIITRAPYVIQLAPEIPNLSDYSSVQQLLTGQAALDLATSDAVVQQVLVEVADQLPPEERTLASLQKRLEAESGGNPSIVNLRATADSAQRAADIANAWAGAYVRQVNDIYFQPADQLGFFEGQLAQAREDLDRADQALTEFQARSDLAILEAQLSAKQDALTDYLTMSESLVLLQQNIGDLQDQLARLPADSASSLGDGLAQLLLQVTAFSAQASDLPILLQIPATGGVSNQTVGQQAAYLADLAETIASKQAEVKAQTASLPTEIRSLQGQMQAIAAESVNLSRERDLAEKVHTTLAQKTKEAEITAQDTSKLVRLASSAVAPEQPMSRGRLINTMLGLMLGLIASVLIVLAVEYVREPAAPSPDARPERQPAAEIA